MKISLLGPLRARLDYRVFKLRGEPLHSVVHRVYAGRQPRVLIYGAGRRRTASDRHGNVVGRRQADSGVALLDAPAASASAVTA